MTAKPGARCETLPDALPDAGLLVAWLPLAHTATKLAALLHDQGFVTTWVAEEGRLDIAFAAGQLEAVARAIEKGLSGEEQRATRALCLAPDTVPTVRDFQKVVPLPQLIGLAKSRWIIELLAEDRLTSHFQPIVHAGDPTRIFAHEALLRGRALDGSLVAPGLLFDGQLAAQELLQGLPITGSDELDPSRRVGGRGARPHRAAPDVDTGRKAGWAPRSAATALSPLEGAGRSRATPTALRPCLQIRSAGRGPHRASLGC